MKFDHILFPVDFTGHSRSLHREVEWLAERFQSNVTLLHVDEIPTNWRGEKEVTLLTGVDIATFREDAKRRLQEYAIRIPESRLERVCIQGDAAKKILERSRRFPTDLIVMSTQGMDPLRGMILGSVSLKVLHEANCPLWMHTPSAGESEAFTDVDSILCPIELTTETVPLLHFASDLAASLNARVHLLHCLPEQELRAGHKFVNHPFVRALSDEAADAIGKMQRLAGTDFQVTITSGSVAHDAAEFASDLKADLILIGRGHAQRAFGSLRTHAFEITRRAHCPVLSFSARVKEADLIGDAESAGEPVVTNG